MITRAAIRGDFGMTVEILADPVADGERVVPEEFVQDRDIVVDEGLLVTVELLYEFCMDLRIVDFRTVILLSKTHKYRKCKRYFDTARSGRHLPEQLGGTPCDPVG
jgi:hypothetical protein